MLYEAKQGTKAYEYIKGIVEAELQERVNYKKRIVEAIGSDFDKDIHVENNRLLSRRFRIEKILVTPEQRIKLDKRAWVKIMTHRLPSGVYHYLIPNVKTEQGRAVSQVLASYKPVAGFNDVRIGLNLTEPVNRPIKPFRLYFFRSRAFVYVDEPSMRFRGKDETLEEFSLQLFYLDFYDELNEINELNIKDYGM
jgi:hypothetical protein